MVAGADNYNAFIIRGAYLFFTKQRGGAFYLYFILR